MESPCDEPNPALDPPVTLRPLLRRTSPEADLSCPPTLSQHRGQHSTSPPETIHRRVDPVKLQRDADDLARLAQTIPTDAASIRQGMLPKDTIQKLKQIEKLSKRLRAELTP